MEELRHIMHIDMDAFYASVEQRDNPELKGMPVVVGGNPKGRGVVTTCSYEARKYGIHSAMPTRIAYGLCPQAIFVKPRFEVYKTASDQIFKIFHEFADLVQPVSLDEAYLDVTEKCKNIQGAKVIAQNILNEIIKRIKITASAGVSFNKFLAKVGSDFKKPNGITVISLEDADEFIDNLPIGKFFGIGKVTEKRMLELRIHNGAELKDFGLENLKKHFGRAGEYFYNCALGIDDRPVRTHWLRRSLGKQRTLAADTSDIEEMISMLSNIAEKIGEHLKEDGLKGRTITLKVRYHNFQTITRSISLQDPFDDANIIMKNVKQLLAKSEAGERKVRLLGISISNFVRNGNKIKYKQSVFEM